jgi:hypothetical protein
MPEPTGAYREFGSVDLLEFGEDGDWLCCQGHVDLFAFLASAHRHLRVSWGPSEIDGFFDEWTVPRHAYYRPVTREDVLRDLARYVPADDLDEEVERALTWRTEEGWMHRCQPEDPGAEPWTEIVHHELAAGISTSANGESGESRG